MTTSQEKAKTTSKVVPKEEKKEPKWKTETKKERTVNPMTMVPEDVSISGKMPLPPNAEEIKRLYGL